MSKQQNTIVSSKTDILGKNLGFNTALFLDVPNYERHVRKSPSPSPNHTQNEQSLHNYLPFDLIDKIESISPANISPNLSRTTSSNELKSHSGDTDFSLKEEEEDLYEYDNIKFLSQKPKNDDESHGSLSTAANHKSSVGSVSSSFSCSKTASSLTNPFKVMQYQFMQNMCKNFNNRKSSMQQQMPNWMKNLSNNQNEANVVQKPKKKNKKKKKKEKDEFTIEMFGRRGWICEQCNNFNYDSRNKCNRCGIPKQPKKIIRMSKAEGEVNQLEHKGDWTCSNCSNINYAFRLICNRCQMPKGDLEKEEEVTKECV